MKERKYRVSPLAEVEMEVLEAGREWMRLKMEKKLQKLANDQGKISPPKSTPFDPMSRDQNYDNNECGKSNG